MTRHAITGELRLRLHLPAGRIEIATWDEPAAEVEVEPLDGTPAAAELAASVTQRLHDRPGGHELQIETPGRRGLRAFSREPQLRFAIRVPLGTHVDAETASADIDVPGRIGDADLRTASGDVALEEATGDVAIKAVSGDVRLGSVARKARVNTVSGDVELESVGGEAIIILVSGDVRVHEAAASIEVKSVSGDVDLESVRRGEVRLQSVSGDLTIAIERGARLWMDVASLSGDTSSELDVSDAGSGGDIDLRVRANSTSGDIRLLRSQRAPA